jgi:hypothetical protein
MHKYLHYFFLTFAAYLLLVSYKENSISYQTECISIGTEGYIILKIWDSNKGIKYKLQQAKKDAIHAVLYSGISGNNNCVTQSAILTKQEYVEKFHKIEKDFFSSNGDWSKFTTSSATETTLPNSLGAKKWKVYQISVSKDALKKYLEEKSILKSINIGF